MKLFLPTHFLSPSSSTQGDSRASCDTKRKNGRFEKTETSPETYHSCKETDIVISSKETLKRARETEAKQTIELCQLRDDFSRLQERTKRLEGEIEKVWEGIKEGDRFP